MPGLRNKLVDNMLQIIYLRVLETLLSLFLWLLTGKLFLRDVAHLYIDNV